MAIVLAALALGLAIAAPAWIAGLELFGQSSRAETARSYYADSNYLSWRVAGLWMNAELFGSPSEPSEVLWRLFHRTHAAGSGWGALGVLPLALAALAALRCRSREVRFWLVLGLSVPALLVVLSTPLGRALHRALPFLGHVDLLRGLIVWNLAGTVLAAFGAVRLFRAWRSPRRRGWLLYLIAFLIVGLSAMSLARAGLGARTSLLGQAALPATVIGPRL